MVNTNFAQQIKFDILRPFCSSKKERGQYNKTPKEKVFTDWEKMQLIYVQLANYCPLPLFETEKEIYNINSLRLWCSNYEAEEYEYLNDSGVSEKCKGEKFKVIEAEIIGTESWSIEDRLFLHNALLENLRSGLDIKSAVEKIQPDFNRIKNRYKTTEIVKWLKQHRG